MIIVEKHLLDFIAFITDRVKEKYDIDIYEDCIEELEVYKSLMLGDMEEL